MILQLPPHSHGEILILLENSRAARINIAMLTADVNVAVQRLRSENEMVLWAALHRISPDILKYTNRAYDASAHAVVELDAEGHQTGAAIEIPQEYWREIDLIVDETANIEKSVEIMPLIIAAANKRAATADRMLMSAVAHYLPQTAEGAWELDPKRMAMVRVEDVT